MPQRIRADQVSVGQVIDYRGAPAIVTRAWKDGTGAAPGIPEPVGIEFVWVNPAQPGEPHSTRLVWPQLSATEKAMIKSARALAEQEALHESTPASFLGDDGVREPTTAARDQYASLLDRVAVETRRQLDEVLVTLWDAANG